MRGSPGSIPTADHVLISRRQEIEELTQMQEEIELLRSLQHPNIVTYLGTDVCNDKRMLYIFTEWVPGGSIQAVGGVLIL
mmetsp:Transcript_28195/g.87253  ORF Transcript_28195/g.87253 Transcript_28195/m.87253 type:complete len:80 (-) Transcript_28195:1895-2134(-)